MRNKNTVAVGYWFLTLLIFSVVFCYFSDFTGYRVIAVWFIIVIAPLVFCMTSVSGGSFKYYWCFLCSVFFVFCCGALLYIRAISCVKLGVPDFSVRSVSGIVVYDSSFSRAGNHVMTIYLKSADSYFGQNVSCSGLITAVGRQKAIISSGLKIRLSGSFKENGLFIYDSYQVLNRNLINTMRERLIVVIEKRICPHDGTDSDVLSMMLLTGRSEIFGTEIRDLAQACGCIHVLALSGMHLHFVTYISRLIKNKAIRYFVSALFVLCFVFIAGPRPSLVRSAIMVLLVFIPIKERLAFTLLLHILLFPLSVLNVGSIYGYVAVFALVVLEERIWGLKCFSSSVAVVLLNAPIQMLLSGCWYPAALIAGPAASVLVFLSMLFGSFMGCFGHHYFSEKLNDIVYNLFIKLFTFCSTFPSVGWKGYAVMVMISLTLIVIPVALYVKNRNLALKLCSTSLKQSGFIGYSKQCMQDS